MKILTFFKNYYLFSGTRFYLKSVFCYCFFWNILFGLKESCLFVFECWNQLFALVLFSQFFIFIFIGCQFDRCYLLRDPMRDFLQIRSSLMTGLPLIILFLMIFMFCELPAEFIHLLINQFNYRTLMICTFLLFSLDLLFFWRLRSTLFSGFLEQSNNQQQSIKTFSNLASKALQRQPKQSQYQTEETKCYDCSDSVSSSHPQALQPKKDERTGLSSPEHALNDLDNSASSSSPLSNLPTLEKENLSHNEEIFS